MQRSRSGFGIWILVGTIAAAARSWHLGWGLPAVEEEALPAKKAFEMWGWAQGHLQLDPQTAGWPALSFYFHLALQKLGYFVQQVRGVYAEPSDYFVAYQLDPSGTILLARAGSAVASLVVVGVGVALAWRAGGRFAAALVGLCLALSPFLVEQAQLVTPDILLAAFSAVALWFLVRIHETGRTRDYVAASVAIGLGAACKYTPVVLTLSLYLTHLLRLGVEGRSRRRGGFDDPRLGVAALVALLSFCAASPYTLFSLDVLKRDFRYQALHMSEGHFGQASTGVGWWFYVRDAFQRALGWPGLVVSAVALAWAAATRRGVWLVIALGGLPFFVFLGALSTRFDRYMLPAILPLALGLAAATVWMREHLRPRTVAAGRAVLAVAVLAPLLLGAWTYHERIAARSTRQLATEWVHEHVDPQNETLASELYGPELSRDKRLEWRNDPAFLRLGTERQKLLLAQPYYHFQMLPLYSVRATLSEYYYDLRHFLAYDYVITSGAVRHRYEADPERFATQLQFYADLDRYTELVATFEPGPRTRGPRIRVYRLDDAAAARALADKGPRPADDYEEWIDTLHTDHLEAFLDGIAAHATVVQRFDIAAEYYRKLTAVSKGAVKQAAFERMAETRMRAGQYEEAERLYRELLAREPRSAYALGNLASIAEERGRIDEAIALYERCIAESGNDPRAGAWARAKLQGLREDGDAPR